MNKYLFFLALSFISINALADSRYFGKVRPYYWGDSLYIALVDVQKTDVPTCATRNVVRLQETDQNSAPFKNKFSILLAAWMAGKDVDLRGTGLCTSNGDEYIYVVIPQ